jgi:hypothetical protein
MSTSGPKPAPVADAPPGKSKAVPVAEDRVTAKQVHADYANVIHTGKL